MTEYEYARIRKIRHNAQESLNMDVLFLIDKIEKLEKELMQHKAEKDDK